MRYFTIMTLLFCGGCVPMSTYKQAQIDSYQAGEADVLHKIQNDVNHDITREDLEENLKDLVYYK